MDDFNLVYNAPSTLQDFHMSNAFMRFTIGPFGSGKTHALIMELLRRAVQQAPGADGIRRTRFAIVRNTLPQLKSSVLPDIQQILGPIVHYKVSDHTIVLRFNDVHSEWMLLPLAETQDQRRLLSLQLTGAWIAEFREVNQALLPSIAGRVGRYPTAAMGGPTWFGVFGESNPFSEDSPWYNYLVLDPPQDVDFFKQPGGRDALAENIDNLPRGRLYYERLSRGHDEGWIKVHVDGEFGDSLAGQAVFRKSFIPHKHITKDLTPIPMRPLIIGMDFGRHPAAVVGQEDARGRLVVLGEEYGDSMGIEKFVSTKLTPLLLSDRFAGFRHFIVGDPSGMAKTQVGEESVFDVLSNEGFQAVPAPTNDIDPRLRVVEKVLLDSVDQEPAFLIDRPHCPLLCRALTHDYRYRRKRDDTYEEIPEKNHPASDMADALQCLCFGVTMNLVGGLTQAANIEYVNMNPPVAGWC